jgi:hypothetical protein
MSVLSTVGYIIIDNGAGVRGILALQFNPATLNAMSASVYNSYVAKVQAKALLISQNNGVGLAVAGKLAVDQVNAEQSVGVAKTIGCGIIEGVVSISTAVVLSRSKVKVGKLIEPLHLLLVRLQKKFVRLL